MKPSGALRATIAAFLFKLLSSPLERACRLLVVLVAAPALGASGFGTYQFASTVTAMLAAGTELGLGMWTTRAIAREPAHADTTAATGTSLRLAAALPYVVLLLIAAATETPGEPRRAMLVFGAAALGSSFVDYFGAILRGREEFRDEAVMNAVRAVATAACSLAALRVIATVTSLAIGMTLGTAVGIAWGARRLRVGRDGAASGIVWTTRRSGERAVVPDWAVVRAVLRETLPLWLSGMFAMLYFRSDIVVVRAFSGEAEVGAYAASYRIFEATLLVPSAAVAVVFPRLVRAAGPGVRTTRLEVWLTSLLLVIGVILAAAILLADARIVLLLLGATFDRAILSLRVLAFAIPVMFVSFALSTFVVARGRERSFAKVLGGMLVLNVGLNLWLVPRFGGVGAAWSTLVTELALVAACVFVLAASEPKTSPA